MSELSLNYFCQACACEVSILACPHIYLETPVAIEPKPAPQRAPVVRAS